MAKAWFALVCVLMALLVPCGLAYAFYLTHMRFHDAAGVFGFGAAVVGVIGIIAFLVMAESYN